MCTRASARDFGAATYLKMFMPRPALPPSCFVVLFVLFLFWGDGARVSEAASITLNPMQDTFISEAFTSPNGTGVDMVVGAQGANASFSKNRGLIQFDLSSVPPGAVVNSVSLHLTVTKVSSTPVNSNFQLHRLLHPWSDLESTWTLRLEPDENWATPGGQEGNDFSATISGSVPVAGLGEYTFASTQELVTDVAAWLANPASNHGWLLKTADESVGFTARRIASAEGPIGAPVLEVQFETPEPPRISRAEITDNQFCLRFTTRQGKSYVVERRDRVDTGEWAAITNLPPADVTGEAIVCDPLGTGTGFYRVGER
jgi:hypothetical protein